MAKQLAHRTVLWLSLVDIAVGFTANAGQSPLPFREVATRGTRARSAGALHQVRSAGRSLERAVVALPALPVDGQDLTVTENGVFVVDSMPPPLPPLNNDYYLLRHGQSWGNVENVISSARSLATSDKHGLTELGFEQGQKSAVNLLDMIATEDSPVEKTRVFFYSSPFARARQTAQACMEGLREESNLKKVNYLGLDIQKDMILEDDIMERYFGDLDDKAIGTYGKVWPVDMVNVTNTEYNVESVAAVSTRIRNTLTRIDASPIHSEREGRDIVVLVSHADVLQITQLYAANVNNVGNFSSYRFTNGEVRSMKRTPDSLPEPDPLPFPTDA